MTRTNRPLAPMERKTLRILERAREGITRERLIPKLYGEAPPRTAHTAVAVHITRLRAALVFKTILTEYGSHRYWLVDVGTQPCPGAGVKRFCDHFGLTPDCRLSIAAASTP